MKRFLLLLVCFFSDCSAQDIRIDFWNDTWEIRKGNFEYRIYPEDLHAKMDFDEFFNEFSIDDFSAEAVEYVERLYLKDQRFPNPDTMRLCISGINVRRLYPLLGDDWDSLDTWYIKIDILAWGNQQISGIPITFTLVYLPGIGFIEPQENPKEQMYNKTGDLTAEAVPHP